MDDMGKGQELKELYFQLKHRLNGCENKEHCGINRGCQFRRSDHCVLFYQPVLSMTSYEDGVAHIANRRCDKCIELFGLKDGNGII